MTYSLVLDLPVVVKKGSKVKQRCFHIKAYRRLGEKKYET